LKKFWAGTQDSGFFFCASYEIWVVVFLASPALSAGFKNPIVIARFWSATAANSADSQRLIGCVQNSHFPFGKEVAFPRRFVGIT